MTTSTLQRYCGSTLRLELLVAIALGAFIALGWLAIMAVLAETSLLVSHIRSTSASACGTLYGRLKHVGSRVTSSTGASASSEARQSGAASSSATTTRWAWCDR